MDKGNEMVLYDNKDSHEVAEACRTLLKKCMDYSTSNIGMTLQIDELFLDVKFSFKINDKSGKKFKINSETITS